VSEERVTHPLTRQVTVVIVLVAVATAIAGYLQVQASRKSNDAGQEAQRLATLSMAQLLTSQQNAQVQYELFLQAQDQRGHAGNSLQASVFARGDALRAYRVEQGLWQTLADHTQSLTPLAPNSPDGPQNDPAFPRHFFARSTQDALRYQAAQDAANATNSSWESVAARYTAILTLFAVALYLLGFAMALPDQVLRLFAGIGTVLLVVGAGWGAQVTLSSPSTISGRAADEYARGEIALETAAGPDSARIAVEHFSRAIDLWPGFGRAFLGRANATLFGSAAQVTPALIPPDDLARANSDLRTAQGLGFDNALVLEQLSATEFSLGLHDQPGRFREAADDSRLAIAAVPDDPVARLTLAANLLADGHTADATSAYGDAMSRVLYLHGDPSQPRNSLPFEQVWVSGALSDLEALSAARPDLADEVGRMKELVVGSLAAGRPSAPGEGPSFSGVHVQLSPTSLAWSTEGDTGFDPSTQALSAEWYFRPAGATWVAMPEVSGLVDSRVDTASPRLSVRNLASSSIPSRCLTPGDYRVELYAGGHLAGEAHASAPFGSLQAFIDRSVNLEVCHPADWQLTDSSLPGFRDGLTSPEGSQGVYLFRYNVTGLPESLKDLDPGDLTDRLMTATVRRSGTLFPAPVTTEGAAAHTGFQGLEGPTERSFGYAGGYVQGQAGMDPREGAVFVTLVFGPPDAFVGTAGSPGDLAAVVQSIGEYRPG
jgi:hypothetical protein